VRFTFQSLFGRPWPHGPWVSHELAQTKRWCFTLPSQPLRVRLSAELWIHNALRERTPHLFDVRHIGDVKIERDDQVAEISTRVSGRIMPTWRGAAGALQATNNKKKKESYWHNKTSKPFTLALFHVPAFCERVRIIIVVLSVSLPIVTSLK
jgi:hypothetical protein